MRFRGVHSRAFVRNCYVSCLYKELGSFLFGCCIGQSLTNMAKLSVGRLRPNFLDVCNITYASINCKEGIYVPAESIVCSAEKKLEEEARCVVYMQLSAFSGCCIQKPKLMCNIWLRLWIFSFRKSFFSGHASFAMYTMLYLAVSHLCFTNKQTHPVYRRTNLESWPLHTPELILCNYCIHPSVYSIRGRLQFLLCFQFLKTTPAPRGREQC